MAARDYELILMLDPQTADEQREKIAADAKSRIESGGDLKHESSWGLRKMAFEIRQRTEADYRYIRFAGEKDLLDGLDHSLKITDGVLRFRIFSIEPDSPVIEPPDTAQVMRRDDDGDRDRGRGRGGRGGPRRGRYEGGGEGTREGGERSQEGGGEREAPAEAAEPAQPTAATATVEGDAGDGDSEPAGA